MNVIVLKLKLLNNWLKTLLMNVIEKLEKMRPKSLAYTVLALMLWSILTLVALIVLSGCAHKPPPIVQPHKPLPPPPDYLMANPPTADLIPKHMQGQSARKSLPNLDASNKTAQKPQ